MSEARGEAEVPLAVEAGGEFEVLAIRLDTIGDVIMTTPALAAMAEGGARVTLLTSSFAMSLAPMMPYVAEFVALDAPWMKPAERHLQPSGEHLRTLDRLRRRRFDLAVVFTVSTQDPSCAAYLSYLAGAVRTAAHVRDRLYGLVTDPVPDTDGFPPARHEVDRQLDLVGSLGFPARDRRLRLTPPPPGPRVRAILERVEGTPWCLVHPGATAPSRRYPDKEWARTIDLLERFGTRVVLCGGKQDRVRCEEISSSCEREPVRADARLPLPELAALTAAAPVAATCNSAAAHIAAAVGTPVVTLYAGTNPQHTPWSGASTVLRRHTDCTWCLSSACRRARPVCIASIPPSTVAEAVMARAQGAEALPARAQDAPLPGERARTASTPGRSRPGAST